MGLSDRSWSEVDRFVVPRFEILRFCRNAAGSVESSRDQKAKRFGPLQEKATKVSKAALSDSATTLLGLTKTPSRYIISGVSAKMSVLKITFVVSLPDPDSRPDLSGARGARQNPSDR